MLFWPLAPVRVVARVIVVVVVVDSKILGTVAFAEPNHVVVLAPPIVFQNFEIALKPHQT